MEKTTLATDRECKSVPHKYLVHILRAEHQHQRAHEVTRTIFSNPLLKIVVLKVVPTKEFDSLLGSRPLLNTRDPENSFETRDETAAF